MTLLMFNNGTEAAQSDKQERTQARDTSIKQLDFSVRSKPALRHTLADLSQATPTAKKKATIASPNQTLSYINTGKVADSLDNRRRLRASHVMTTPVITAMAHELVSHAKTLMHENDISHIVIINTEQKPLGLINAIELLGVESPQSSFIHSIVDLKVLAVSDDTLVRDIALIFMKYKTSAISVVDQQHTVIGIITRSDLLSLLVSGPNQRIKA